MAQLTQTQALERAAEWLRAEPGMTVTDDGVVTVDGMPPLEVNLIAETDRLVITHVHEDRGAGSGRADAVLSSVPDRGTLVQVSAAVAKAGVTFTFTNPVYHDGFSRQALLTSFNDLVALVDRLGGVPLAETRVHQAVTAAPSQPAAVVVDRDPAEVEMSVAGWKPTHRVPTGGMRAWDEPDPAAQPTSRLEARVELQVAERRGDWARAVGSNGWTGWVDARKIEEIGGVTKSGSSTINIAGFNVSPLPLLGAAALLLAAFLPWVSVSGGAPGVPGTSINSFEVALPFLWDTTASGSPYLGFALVALAALAVVVAAGSKSNPGLIRVLGLVAIALAAAFVVSMYRGVSAGGGGFGDVFDLLGFAPWVTVGAGAVMLAAARK
jgi:hypothetical protein